MKEALFQTFDNLWAHKLRSCLTMFGILWGVISVVVLSATGEGFRQGNEHVLRELGKNIAIVWGGRTSLQAGGERAGRRITLTADDARILREQSRLVRVATPELRRTLSVKSAYNAGAPNVHGVEPSYQDIRTLDLESGRQLNWEDERSVHRVAILGDDIHKQLFAGRTGLGETITLNGVKYAVVGKLRHKDQDSNYSGPDNDKVFVPFAAMKQDFPLPDATEPDAVSNIIVAPQQWVVDDLPRQLNERTGPIRDIDWALEKDVRHTLARHKAFDADDKEAIWVWDTSVNSLMFGRMVDTMRDFFTTVGYITLALGGLGVMNIMLISVKERTREIGVRKALGATTLAVLRQFFMEGFFITMLSGAAGMAVALGICAAINTLPMPERFSGMILSPQAAALTVCSLVIVGILTALYPARRAADLPPVEALRYEM